LLLFSLTVFHSSYRGTSEGRAGDMKGKLMEVSFFVALFLAFGYAKKKGLENVRF
jgi:hypothetical protein